MGEGQFMPPGTLRVLTQHLCAAGIFILLQNVENNAHHLMLESLQKIVTSLFQAPVLEKAPESSPERKPACGWLSPCSTTPVNVPPGESQPLWLGVHGAEAPLAARPCHPGSPALWRRG